MKLEKILLVLLAVAVVVATAVTVIPAGAQSDKYDADCTGSETEGRCADKCPPNTAEGSYFVRGHDKVTGEVSCGFTFYNECPYAAGYSATDPMCAKLGAEQQAQQPVSVQDEAPIEQNESWGK